MVSYHQDACLSDLVSKINIVRVLKGICNHDDVIKLSLGVLFDIGVPAGTVI